MHARISAALMTLAVCGHAAQVSAQEYCVTCTEPAAKYRCAIGGDPPPAARSSRGQLLCISELAQAGQHASCSVGRATADPCEGELRTVMFPSGVDLLPPSLAEPQPVPGIPEEQSPGLAAGEPGQEAPADAPPPPQTVEELAKQTVDASGKGLKQAGEAVGDTAKSTGEAVGNALSKTWKCMSSLFSDC